MEWRLAYSKGTTLIANSMLWLALSFSTRASNPLNLNPIHESRICLKIKKAMNFNSL